MKDFITINDTKYSATNRFFIIVFLFMLAFTYFLWIKVNEEPYIYSNEKEFIIYADNKFDSSRMLNLSKPDKTDYEFGNPVSYAVGYSECDNDNIDTFRDEKIQEIKDLFISDYISDADSNEEADIKAETEYAVIINACVYKCDKGINNLIIYEDINKIEDNKSVTTGDKVYTYQFSEKTGEPLIKEQIFKENYKKYCEKYCTDYFIKEYDEDELKQGWQDYVSDSDENYNKYAVTNSGLIFYFEEGSILDEKYGVISCGIPIIKTDKILRTKIIERYIDKTKPMVAITYDDGPGGTSEQRILECLENNNAVATFFYQGYRIAGNEDKIKRAYEMDCEIGSHTWDHPVLTKLNDEQLNVQLSNTNEAIKNACGHYPTVFRPSYGITNDAINIKSGLPVIMWSVDTLDWESRDGTAVMNLVKNSGNLDGKIILLHSIHDSTADATEMMVPWLKSMGYQIVTVSELIEYKSGEKPIAGTVYR